MTQITLIGKYHDKGLNATEIFHILKEIFEDDSLAYSSITYHLRKKSWTEISEEAKNRGGRPANFRIDSLILKELNSDCTLSCHQIAKNIGYSYTSVRYVLTERLCYKPYNLKWVPHVLNFSQKQKRVEYSIELIEILKRAKKNGWQFISTGDESWFFYRTPGGIIWLPEGENPPETARNMPNDPKIMVTIFWNPNGLQIIDGMESGQRFNSSYFIEKILKNIALDECVAKAKKHKQRFILHMDNSPVHKSKIVQEFIRSHGMFMPPHPPYSPDLSPCDFYLFGLLKKQLVGKTFDSVDELLCWIEEKFDSISKSELQKVFDEWLIRLQKVIDAKGDYIE